MTSEHMQRGIGRLLDTEFREMKMQPFLERTLHHRGPPLAALFVGAALEMLLFFTVPAAVARPRYR